MNRATFYALSTLAALRAWLPVLVMVATFAALNAPREARASTCSGRFANPVTDFCWSCLFPIRIGRATLIGADQDDVPAGPGGLCHCRQGASVAVGLEVSFWEPIRRVDVTINPFCAVSLGGVKLASVPWVPEGTVRWDPADGTQQSWYHVHWYTDPFLYWSELLLDHRCLERGEFDLAYLSELDPLWNDDELTLLLSPDVVLFANPAAIAACAADCVAATAGMPMSELFWCAGCMGPLYPLNGHIQAHVGAVQATSLALYRMAAKLHRELLARGSTGAAALCGTVLQPVMDKRQYKTQMLYPVRQTERTTEGTSPGAATAAGQCCQPIGRAPLAWGAGKEVPFDSHNFAYMLYRKRDCCLSAELDAVAGAVR